MIKHVITFIKDTEQEKGGITESWIAEMRHIIAQHVTIQSEKWLHEGEAYDIEIDGPINIYQIADTHLNKEKIDAICQPVEGRRKKMLISDMDSTMIQQECIDEIAAFAGLKEKVAVITERAMNGELEFQDALRERVSLLKGLSEEVLQEAYEKHIDFMPGAKVLVQTMRGQGALCVLVSGGFTFFTERVSSELGFHHDESNKLEIHDNILTGKVIGPIKDKDSKVEALERYQKKHTLDIHAILAVGDGANDLPMLSKAGLGIAYHAKPVVQAQAQAKINNTSLTALLYVQGYLKSEWVL